MSTCNEHNKLSQDIAEIKVHIKYIKETSDKLASSINTFYWKVLPIVAGVGAGVTLIISKMF